MTIQQLLTDGTSAPYVSALAASSDFGENIEIVCFSASFKVGDAELHVKRALLCINNTFHLDALYQVECYLIRRYQLDKFTVTPVLHNVTSKELLSGTAPTGGNNKDIPKRGNRVRKVV